MITTRALSKLAQASDVGAQFRLGYRLAFGRGRSQRWAEARLLVARAEPGEAQPGSQDKPGQQGIGAGERHGRSGHHG